MLAPLTILRLQKLPQTIIGQFITSQCQRRTIKREQQTTVQVLYASSTPTNPSASDIEVSMKSVQHKISQLRFECNQFHTLCWKKKGSKTRHIGSPQSKINDVVTPRSNSKVTRTLNMPMTVRQRTSRKRTSIPQDSKITRCFRKNSRMEKRRLRQAVAIGSWSRTTGAVAATMHMVLLQIPRLQCNKCWRGQKGK